jgi:hypothetical protein
MKRYIFRVLGMLAAVTMGVGCASSSSKAEPQFRLGFQVRSSDGKGLSGAKITVDKRLLGTSDVEGKLGASLSGREGQEVVARVTCPAGFRGPELPETVRLTQTRSLDENKTSSAIAVEFTCESETRDVVIVVQSKGGANLPLRVGSESAGTTDKDGNAQLLVHVDRNQSTLEVGIDTESRRELQPRSPSRNFTLGRNDALVLYNEPFSTAKTKAKRVLAKRAVPHRPIRLD